MDENYKTLVEESAKSANWYILYRQILLKYLLLILLFIFVYQRGNLIQNSKTEKILSFALFFGVFANIISIVPSGFRFLSVSNGLMWFVLIPFLINNINTKNWRPIDIVTLSILFLNLIVGFRYLLDTASIEFFIGNLFSIFIYVTDAPVIEFIKSLTGG